MRAKGTEKVAQIASKAISKARPRPVESGSPHRESNLGRQIFVYNHLQTNQVVYSLTKSLKVSLYPFAISPKLPLFNYTFFADTAETE
jgi:hypothetical protein